jgi:hypothetical protein
MSRAQTDFSAMSRATKVALFVSSLLGLLTGIATGVPEGKALAARLFSLRTAAVAQELSAFSATQFQHADEAHARAAVLLEIQALDQIRHLPRQYQLVTPQGELRIAYARLAMVEETSGNSAAAKAAFQQARAWQNSLHPGHEVTDEQFRKFVRQRDEAIAKMGP